MDEVWFVLLASAVSSLLCEIRQCLVVCSLIQYDVALAESLGSLPGSKAVPQTTYATYLQSTIPSNLPAPLWTLYQRSWSDPRRRSDAFPSLTQSSSLISLNKSTVKERRPIQQQRPDLVIPGKESRGQSSASCWQEFSLFEDASALTKLYFFVFIAKDNTKQAGCPRNPCSPHLNEE